MSFGNEFNGVGDNPTATQGGNVADRKNGNSNENNVVADILVGIHQSQFSGRLSCVDAEGRQE
jgi:hypothetical protein